MEAATVDVSKFTSQQIWDDSGTYLTASQRFGCDDIGTLSSIIFKLYPVATDVDISFVDTNDKWRISRDPLNDRGDRASVEERCASIQSIGILQNIRGGAWLCACSDVNALGPDAQFTALHYATLNDGAKLAWERDPEKKNRTVQASIQQGLKRSTIFRKDTPRDCKVFLKELGNLTNKSSLAKTFLEVYRSTETVEAAWQRQCKDSSWTHASIGQAKMEANHLLLANSLFKKCWPSYTCYEQCWGFFRDARKYQLTDSDGNSSTMWDFFCEWCQKHVDFTNRSTEDHARVFRLVHLLFKRLKEQPMVFKATLSLIFPLVSGPAGKCALLPGGLSSPALAGVSDEAIQELLRPMRESKSAHDAEADCKKAGEQLVAAEAVAQKAEAKKAAKAAAAAEKRARGRGRGRGRASSAATAKEPTTPSPAKRSFSQIMPGQSQESFDDSFAGVVCSLRAYLTRIDPRLQESELEGYMQLCYFAALNGRVVVGDKVITKFSILRKQIKAAVYRAGRLKPRQSDEDFIGDETFNQQSEGPQYSQLPLGQLEELFEPFAGALQTALGFFSSGEAGQGLELSMEVAKVVNKTVMGAMQKLLGGGASADSQMVVLRSALESVSEVLPTQACQALALFDEVAEQSAEFKSWATGSQPTVAKLRSLVDPVGFKLWQIWVVCKCMAAAASMTYPKQEGGDAVNMPYIRSLCNRHANYMLKLVISYLKPGSGDSGLTQPKEAAAAVVSLLQKSKWKSGSPDVDTFCMCWLESLDSLEQCWASLDVGSYTAKRDATMAGLQACSYKELAASMHSDFGINVKYGTQTRAIIMQYMCEYDRKHELVAKAQEASTNDMALHTQVLGKMTSELTLPIDVASSSAMVASGQQSSSAAGGDSISNKSISLWLASVKEEEVKSCGVTNAWSKEVMARLQFEMNALCERYVADPAKAYGSAADALCVEIDDSGKKPKATVIQTASGSPVLPIWGRVVDKTIATHLPRSMVLPLRVEWSPLSDPTAKHQLECYVEGSKFSNISQSTCCLAWFVGVQPIPKPVEEEEPDETTPKKKRGIKAQKAQKAKKVKVESYSTHEVTYCEPIKFQVGSALIQASWPQLSSKPVGDIEWPVSLLRARDSWDDVELEAEWKPRAERAFVLC